jgi:hypothetical protein
LQPHPAEPLFSAVMLSRCFCIFSDAGLAGHLTSEQKSMVLKFVSSEKEYVNVIVHLSKNHPQAIDSIFLLVNQPPHVTNMMKQMSYD